MTKMLKIPIKFNNPDPAVFWRRALITFAVGLVLVFVAQIITMLLLNDISPTVATDQTSQIVKEREDRQKISALMTELTSRPNRLDEILATTTVLFDPSR